MDSTRYSRPFHPARLARRTLFKALLALPLIGGLAGGALAAEPAVKLPDPAIDLPASDGVQTAVVAGGCFWGVQAVYEHTKGVTVAVSGYAGGTKVSPSYEEVSSGMTGHAESVEIKFDPREISYGQILKIFFSVAHNPTELNRQGPDVGTQYRSAIFYANEDQKRVTQAYIEQLGKAGVFERPIVTQLAPLTAFYRAEGYHQDYAINHPTNLYIVFNDAPKIENLKRLFAERYRATPVTVASVGQ